ncbi:MAG: zinc metalloprotease [Flavobacteriales bacterium]|nr:zinc metalloprotease [Flavobacteriales bacterium]
MKIFFSILFLLLLSSLSTDAQTIRCASASNWEKAMKNPDFIRLQEQFEEASSRAKVAKSQTVFIVPVVFHIIYKNATENISESQIMSQLDALNRDFRMRNADTTNVEPDFSKADVQIEFCLARRDPNGNQTNGITRDSTGLSNIGINDLYYIIRPAWDPDRYLNIWVGDYGDINGNEVLGEATPPGHTPRAQDGVIITYRAFGTEGTATAPYNEGRTTTHEVGHWFNLLHPWGGGSIPTCNDGDMVADTPDQDAVYFNCPLNPSVSCGTKDMLSNYMGYVDDDCMGNFSEGQRDRMRNALVLLRPSILLSRGCLPVGLDENSLNDQLTIYPNPADEIIQIRLDEINSPLDFAIYSLDGKMVKSGSIPSGKTEYQLLTEDLNSGIYLLRIGDSESQITKKIILQH